MKAKDLYEMTPTEVTKNLSILKGCYYDFVPEVDVDWIGGLDNQKIEIKTIKHFDFDYRRFWALNTVWFEESPVMVIQNPGREGDDHSERFITSETLYKSMVEYLNSLITKKDCQLYDLIDEDEERNDLIEFYGNELFGHFERHNY